TPGGVRRFPELASLGFFLRRAEMNRALARLRGDAAGLRFPRGLVFHVPPANVATIFVYSWALSALAGNRNVVRISPRAAGAAQGFFNDAYWFDQAACASPRALFWVGHSGDARVASTEFFAHLRGVLDTRGYLTEPAMAVRKLVAAYGAAADGLVGSIRFLGNEIAVLDLRQTATLPGGWMGAGTFLQATVAGLDAPGAIV